MARLRLDPKQVGTYAIAVAGGLFVSGLGGIALGQFALAGIDPQLADTYRQNYVQQIASQDHDLMGQVTPVSDALFDSPGSDRAHAEPVAFASDDASYP